MTKCIVEQRPESALPSTKEYEAYRHVKKLLCSSWESKHLSIQEISEKWGYKNLDKLRRRIEEWCGLRSPVPLQFLELMAISMQKLEESLVLDQTEFENHIQNAKPPSKFFIKYIPGVYHENPLPLGYNQEQMVEEVLKHLSDSSLVGYIPIHPGLTLLVKPDGKVISLVYRPGYKIKQNCLHFSPLGTPLGGFVK